MKAWSKGLAGGALCAFSGALGWLLAGERRASAGRQSAPPSHPASFLSQKPAVEALPDEAMLYRRTLAHCRTDDLWALLRDQDDRLNEISYDAVITELFDRQGVHALEACLSAGEEKGLRSSSEAFLEKLAKKDPWAACEIFQQHRGEFPSAWAPVAREEMLLAACGASAEKTVEIATMVDWEMPSAARPDFPGDYRFRRALEEAVLSERGNRNLRDALLAGWARQAPAETIDWLTARIGPEISRANEELVRVCREVGESSAPGRALALEHLSQLPADLRDWLAGSLGDEVSGRMDSSHLEVLTALGRRETYLTGALLETRGAPSLDASWLALPENQRAPVLEAALAKWLEDDPSPVATEARIHWQEMVRRGWATRPAAK